MTIARYIQYPDCALSAVDIQSVESTAQGPAPSDYRSGKQGIRQGGLDVGPDRTRIRHHPDRP